MRISDCSSDVCSSDLKKLLVACCPCPTPYQARAGHPIVQHLECSNQFGFEQRPAAALQCQGGQRSDKIEIACERTIIRFMTINGNHDSLRRLAEQRVGIGCVSTCSFGWSPYH